MPSLLPGYEYDIFISYRHNDNLTGGVTEFVQHLREELAATLKDPVSIYFDTDPHLGLLETHNVDKSLERKLKCLIFIPIISQTYCDPKSFAWQHEFCTFNKLASEDNFGRDITLANGNVASRILPIKIHDLDAEDIATIQNEIGGVLRPIEFIYKEPGVNRPLKITDERNKNLNQTDYGNQVNKVANAIKEIITSLKNPGVLPPEKSGSTFHQPKKVTRKVMTITSIVILVLALSGYFLFPNWFAGVLSDPVVDKSIAVLPFENMNNDPEQDYFSNGIAEDILNHLSKISDIKVKSRTSTLQYKGTHKTIPEIGEELNVGNIVEGSVRRVGDNVRIVVQLIDAKTDIHLWSETYDRELKDVLALQSEIAIKIASALEARLTASEKSSIQKVASQNATAYDYYLKARAIYNNSTINQRDYERALLFLNEALLLDANFSSAFALKGNIWYEMGFLGISQKIWQDSATLYAQKAISSNPLSPDGYILKGDINRYLGNLKESKLQYYEAYKLSPNDPNVLSSYGGQLLRDNDEQGADLFLRSIENKFSFDDPEYFLNLSNAYYAMGDVSTQEKLLKKSKSLNPGSVYPYLNLAGLYTITKQYDKAIREYEQLLRINPDLQNGIDGLAWSYYLNNDFENAAKYWSMYPEIEARFEDSTQIVPFRHRLGMTYLKMNKKKEADSLFKEDLKIQNELLSEKRSLGTWTGYGAIYYDMAVDNAYLGNEELAVQYLDSAVHYNMFFPRGYHKDPIFAGLQNREDFKKVVKKVTDRDEFRKRAFTNAVNRMEASNELKSILK